MKFHLAELGQHSHASKKIQNWNIVFIIDYNIINPT